MNVGQQERAFILWCMSLMSIVIIHCQARHVLLSLGVSLKRSRALAVIGEEEYIITSPSTVMARMQANENSARV